MENNQSQTTALNRRDFLMTGAAALGGLVVAFHVPGPLKAYAQAAAAAAPIQPNAWVRIAPDNTVTIIINRIEMGQGVHTSMAQLIAEELSLDWKTIKSESSNSDAIYNDAAFHMIMTGGSTSIAHSWEPYRKVGAGLREMLTEAAAKRWGVPVAELNVENGFVVHKGRGKLSFGDLAEEANKLKFPERPTMKSKGFAVIGESVKRLDAAAKSDGTATFSIDVRLPGMVYACIAQPVVPTAKLVSFSLSKARAVPGVIKVMKVADNKVAVVARNTHAAKLGVEALGAKWNAGKFANTTAASMMADFHKQAVKRGKTVKESGKVEEALETSTEKIEADYEFPWVAHAPMEPMNCTIDYDGKKADIYGGIQMPTLDHKAAAKILGLPMKAITIHVTYAGGSFGRRGSVSSDWVSNGCLIAKALKKPVKLTYSREDDMRAGFYRPMVLHKATLGFKDGQLHGWHHRIVGHSLAKGTIFEPMMIQNGVDNTMVEGTGDTKYALPQNRFEATIVDTPVPVSFWRSVGHTHTGYVMETLMDEVAEKTKQDPLEMRLKLLTSSPRHIEVLKLLKKQTDWGDAKAPKGRAWGLAIHESFGSVVGQVAEVSMVDGLPKIHKIWAAVHIGKVVNPEGARTQVEGAIAMGISKALHQQITFNKGDIDQTNFDTFDLIRIQDMPVVDVQFVESEDAPTGIGEPGVPPSAPAIANAIYKLTGKRLRKLPWTRELTTT